MDFGFGSLAEGHDHVYAPMLLCMRVSVCACTWVAHARARSLALTYDGQLPSIPLTKEQKPHLATNNFIDI